MFRLRIAGGAAALGLALMGGQMVDHAFNYLPVTASITRVAATCHLTRVPSGIFAATTPATAAMPCLQAEALRSGHPGYRDMIVTGTIHTTFDYVSPADNAGHSASLAYAYEKYGHLAGLKAGNHLPILAHKSRKGLVAQDYDNLGAFATSQQPGF